MRSYHLLWRGGNPLSPWERVGVRAATYGIEAQPVRDLGLQRAKDLVIYQEAQQAGSVVITKDGDFLDLLDRFGPPPQVLWVTCGNTSHESVPT